MMLGVVARTDAEGGQHAQEGPQAADEGGVFVSDGCDEAHLQQCF